MADEKDRLGEKLHQKEKAEEDRYFAERDRELLARLRNRRDAEKLSCPRCGQGLAPVVYQGVTVDQCPVCQGVWLDAGELEQVTQKAGLLGGFAKLFK